MFLLLCVFSLFIPSHVQLSKAITIRSHPDSLWQLVDDFKSWGQWNTIFPGLSMEKPAYSDSGMKTENAFVKWKSREPGLHVAVIQRNNNRSIISAWKIVSNGTATADSITVQWYIDINLRWYPWEKFAGMLYEKSYGDKLMQGLTQLKDILEN